MNKNSAILMAIRKELKNLCKSIKIRYYQEKGYCPERLQIYSKFIRLHMMVDKGNLIINTRPYIINGYYLDLKNPDNDLDKTLKKIIILYKSANRLAKTFNKNYVPK